jgi:hypothetical protein
MCNKQLQALQEAFERCHAEMKSQREELCAQRREIESFFCRAVPPRDLSMCDATSIGKQPTAVNPSPVEIAGPAAQAPPRNGNGSRVTWERKAFAKLFCVRRTWSFCS